MNNNFCFKDQYLESSCANFPAALKVICNIRWPYVLACQASPSAHLLFLHSYQQCPLHSQNRPSLSGGLHEHCIFSAIRPKWLLHTTDSGLLHTTQSSKGPESQLPGTQLVLSKRIYFLWAVSSSTNLVKNTGEVVTLNTPWLGRPGPFSFSVELKHKHRNETGLDNMAVGT